MLREKVLFKLFDGLQRHAKIARGGPLLHPFS